MKTSILLTLGLVILGCAKSSNSPDRVGDYLSPATEEQRQEESNEDRKEHKRLSPDWGF